LSPIHKDGNKTCFIDTIKYVAFNSRVNFINENTLSDEAHLCFNLYAPERLPVFYYAIKHRYYGLL